MNNPGRYKLHQYLKYAHQWADTVSYKCRLFPIDESHLSKFVTDKLPTLKGKDFKIEFVSIYGNTGREFKRNLES